ncbi:uncharacterized protein LOC144113489 [Amblyomma americanum]
MSCLRWTALLALLVLFVAVAVPVLLAGSDAPDEEQPQQPAVASEQAAGGANMDEDERRPEEQPPEQQQEQPGETWARGEGMQQPAASASTAAAAGVGDSCGDCSGFCEAKSADDDDK